MISRLLPTSGLDLDDDVSVMSEVDVDEVEDEEEESEAEGDAVMVAKEDAGARSQGLPKFQIRIRPKGSGGSRYIN